MRKYIFPVLIAFSLLVSCSYHDDEARSFAKIIDISPKETYGDSYVVKPGDNLYYIAWHFGLAYKNLAKINNIKPPYNLNVGQVLRLVEDRKVASYTPVKVKPQVTSKAKVKTIPKKALDVSWQWPISPKIMKKRSFSGGQRGLEIEAPLNSRISAAADGKVIYVGNGIKGLDNLVIVKHTNDFLTAYGRNKKLLVHEGQLVKKGQAISIAGNQRSGISKLHFEMRKYGKPVNPLKYLPKSKV